MEKILLIDMQLQLGKNQNVRQPMRTQQKCAIIFFVDGKTCKHSTKNKKYRCGVNNFILYKIIS